MSRWTILAAASSDAIRGAAAHLLEKKQQVDNYALKVNSLCKKNKKTTTMKKVLLSLACVSLLCPITCVAETMLVKEKRETGAFRSISSSGGIDVYFTQSNTFSLEVEADTRYFQNIVTEVENEALVVRQKKSINILRFFWRRAVLKVHVSAPALDRVSASGGSDFYAGQLKSDGPFQLSLSGGADATISELAVAQNVDISVNGGADAKISTLTAGGAVGISVNGGADAEVNTLTAGGAVGISVNGGADAEVNTLTAAENVNISANGGADCDVKNLQAASCSLSSAGGSDLYVNLTASGDLKASASGGADIRVSGKASNVNVSAAGGADIDIRNLAYANINVTKSGGGDVDR